MKLMRSKKENTESDQKGWPESGLTLPMFDDFVTRDLFRPTFSTTGVSTPAVNVIETNDDFRLEMVAPGMNKENFNIELKNQILTISYDHDDNREGLKRDWNYRTREYNYHSFARSFSLPETVESERIKANYKDGIMNVIIPKKEESKRKPVRQIKIS